MEKGYRTLMGGMPEEVSVRFVKNSKSLKETRFGGSRPPQNEK